METNLYVHYNIQIQISLTKQFLSKTVVFIKNLTSVTGEETELRKFKQYLILGNSEKQGTICQHLVKRTRKLSGRGKSLQCFPYKDLILHGHERVLWIALKDGSEGKAGTRHQREQHHFIYFSLADELALAVCRQVHRVSGRIQECFLPDRLNS